MATISALYTRIKSLDINKISVDSLSETKERLVEWNKEQMLEGKNRFGNDLPSYLTDPYFKTPESALRYSQWKDKITPNPKRKSGIMNFYIVGSFHNSITAAITGGSIKYDAPFLGREIESKYGDEMYGLGGEIKKEYISKDLRPVFNKKIEQVTGLKLS